MVMGVVESHERNQLRPALAGARVLLTGLEPGHGVDVARAFADAGCRLVVHAPVMSSEIDAVLEELARTAPEVKVTSGVLESDGAALLFAQTAVKSFGGLEAVVNMARLRDDGLAPEASLEDIERRVAQTLGPAFRITDVVANRMQLTWTDGLILNIVTQEPPASAASEMLGRIARAALAGMTRQEAARREGNGVRINAIVPVSADDGSVHSGMTSEPEIAALAVHLATKRDRALSGLVFDAALAGCIGHD